MTEAPISTPPQEYMGIISPLIDKARGFLEAGEKLQAMAFVGNLTTKEFIRIHPSDNSVGKHRGQKPVCADNPVSSIGIRG